MNRISILKFAARPALTLLLVVGLSIAGSSVVKSKASLERMKETERTRARKAWQEAIAEVKSLLEKSDLWPQVEQILTGGMKEAIQA